MVKDVIGYEGLYTISDNGEVYSVKSDKIISKRLSNKGYYQVDLNKDGKRTHKYIHRLVAEAFIPNPNNDPIVLHLDNDKTNVSPDNLKWGTYSENQAQAVADGLSKVPHPDNRRKYVITDDNILIHCNGSKEVAEKLDNNCTPNNVHNLVHRLTVIKNGPYAGFHIEPFENVQMYNNIDKTFNDYPLTKE